jgi:hypothetical protein
MLCLYALIFICMLLCLQAYLTHVFDQAHNCHDRDSVQQKGREIDTYVTHIEP